MATVTENDLKELKDLIAQLGDRMNTQNELVNQKLNHLTVEVAVIKESLNGVNRRFDDVNKRFDDVNKRLDDWKPAIIKATDKADAVAQKMTDLSEKVGELKNWRQVAIIVITGLLTTLFWLLRDGQI
jgi:predicted nuclease with TOPRIM domain